MILKLRVYCWPFTIVAGWGLGGGEGVICVVLCFYFTVACYYILVCDMHS